MEVGYVSAITDESLGVGEEDLVASRVNRFLEGFPPSEVAADEFLGARFDAGLAWVYFPEGHGGLGWPRRLQSLVDGCFDRAGAPDLRVANPIGYGMAAPTIMTLGSEDQRRRYLRPLFTTEDVWCQLFSEPGAGSDVASLATRAVLDGDEWVVNGQKVWTTLAHVARYGMLLARTNPGVPKHSGLTYFVVDMQAPGVDVRPLRQMTGDAEFNEVYLTDVRIPDRERLGEVGAGWRGAIVTLMNERVAGGSGGRSGPLDEVLESWKVCPPHARTTVMTDRLVKLWVETQVLRMTGRRAAALAQAGTPGPEGSIGKLHTSELNKQVGNFCVDLVGAEAMLYDSYEMRRPDVAGQLGGTPQRLFLRSRANSIEAGSSEIMRNILAERVLGLPSEPRVDREQPWSSVPHNPTGLG
jgi:alkylation response protein AidB-like acyl-CoA dehydrogenase